MDEENENHLKQDLLNRRESVSISHIPSADALLSFIHGMNLSFQSKEQHVQILSLCKGRAINRSKSNPIQRHGTTMFV